MQHVQQQCVCKQSHLQGQRDIFTMMKTFKNTLEVVLEDGHVVKAQQQGTVPLIMKLSGNESRKCNFLYVPNLSYNLSISKAVNAEKIVKFVGKYGQIISTSRELTVIAMRIGNLCYSNCYDSNKDCINITIQSNSQEIWHRRFGH